MTIDEMKKLRERMGELATEARAELDKITDDMDEGQVKEIEGRFDAMMADHDKIAARIEREQRLYQVQMPEVEDRSVPGTADDQQPEYSEVFERALRFGVSSLTPAEQRVMQDARADVPEEFRAQGSADAAGGYTVPDEFSGAIDRALKMWGPMWDAAIVRELSTSNGRLLKWPTVDDTAKTGRLKDENASVDDDGTDDVVFGEKKLESYVYDTGMVKIPMELLQDSAFNMESLLTDLFAERLGRQANSILTTGTGTDQPHGIVTASAAGQAPAGVAALTADELIGHLHTIDPAYRMSPSVRWMFNDSTLAFIRKLKDGQGNYLWQLGDVRNGEPATLLGHPYSINQAVADIGASAKSVLFGDMSKYIVRKVMGFQVITLRERYAENFQIGMVGFKRFDGELLNTAAVKHMAHPAT